MKKLSIALAFIVLVSLSSCENEGETCLEVKIVAELCGNAVVQVVSGNAGIPVTESWTDHNNVTYDNVFSTFLDPCDSYLPARGETVLMKAVQKNRLDVVKLLLSSGADINAVNNDGDLSHSITKPI